MMTTDLGACEWFVWDLRRSNLIDRGQLDQIIGDFLSSNPNSEPTDLAEFLVQQEHLTGFQAERLLQGKTQGFVLGPFTLMDSLGSGSMGTVYKARSKNDNNWYAVKVLPRRSMWNVRIARRKVRAFEHCQHPSVVPFVDVGTSGGMHYLAWPLVEGETLESIVEREGPLSPEKAALYAVQAAEGMDSVHHQNLFHGLLKPSNLMMGPDGQIRILDFGIGCLLAETEGESLVDTMSTANSVNSGLDCASPESIMDPTNLTAIGDQYSLGCVLYYFLTGQYPFPDGTAVEKMMAHQTKQPTPIQDLRPDAPDDLVEIIERLMEKNPANRYANCSEIVDLLKPFAEAVAPAPRRVTQAIRPLSHLRQQSRASGNAPRPKIAPKQQQPAQEGSGRYPQQESAEVEPHGSSRPVAPSQRGQRDLPRPGTFNKQGPSVKPWDQQQQAQGHPHADSHFYMDDDSPRSPWMDRLRFVGLFAAAIAAGVAAWFLSSFVKF